MKSKLIKIDLDRGLLSFYDKKEGFFQGLAVPFHQLMPEMLMSFDPASRNLLGAGVLKEAASVALKSFTTFDHFKKGKELGFVYLPIIEQVDSAISIIGSGSFVYNKPQKDQPAKVKIVSNVNFVKVTEEKNVKKRPSGVALATSVLATNYLLKFHSDHDSEDDVLFVYSTDEAIESYRHLGYELYSDEEGAKDNKMFLTKNRAEILRDYYIGKISGLPEYN